MNGYLSPCGGEPCPPVFRLPVLGLDDIMDNQVICAIYKLPDAHKHITRPPADVKFPKKIVTMGDLKPSPVLWHEDSVSKPRENGRLNPHGSISGRQLGEAAHRLVANSLQGRDSHQMHVSYDRCLYYPMQSHPRNHGFHERAHQRMPLPGAINPHVKNHSNYNSNTHHGDRNYNEQHHISTFGHHYSRPHSLHYERNSRSTFHCSRQHNIHDQYASGIPQNVVPMYLEGPRAQTPHGFNARPYPVDHNYYQNNQPAGAFGHLLAGDWVPPANQSVVRGYVHSQLSGNQYSALDRRPNKRQQPPPSSYGR